MAVPGISTCLHNQVVLLFPGQAGITIFVWLSG